MFFLGGFPPSTITGGFQNQPTNYSYFRPRILLLIAEHGVSQITLNWLATPTGLEPAYLAWQASMVTNCITALYFCHLFMFITFRWIDGNGKTTNKHKSNGLVDALVLKVGLEPTRHDGITFWVWHVYHSIIVAYPHYFHKQWRLEKLTQNIIMPEKKGSHKIN